MGNDSRVSMEVELITPQVAHHMMSVEAPNRNLSNLHVTKMANDIRLGFWVLNGETIKVNTKGEVIDGQHRLAACIEADKDIESWVARGLDENRNIQYTTDSGKRRSVSDELKLRGESYTNELAGMASVQWKFLTDRMRSGDAPTTSVGLKIVDRFGGDIDGKGLRHSARWIGRMRMHEDAIKTSSILFGWSHFVFSEIDLRTNGDTDTAIAFLEGVITGANLPVDDPARRLRNRFIKHNSNRKSAGMSPREMRALTIKAWNAYFNGRTMSTNELRYREVGPHLEPFPTVYGQDVLEDWFRIRL